MAAMTGAIRDLLGRLRPHAAAGHRKLRLGSPHDGGYVVLDDLAGLTAAIGCGVGYDVTFEEQLAARGIPVHLFDHTVAGLPRPHPLLHFLRRPVAVANSGLPLALDLAGIVQLCGLQPDSALLKIDIEGDEWGLFAEAGRAALRPYRQIVCEFHWLERLQSPAFFATAREAVANLMRDFAVVHAHANNYAPLVAVEGLQVPSVLELTLASRHCYRLGATAEEFPTPLDAPNNPGQPDHLLGKFDYRRRLAERLWRRVSV